MKRPLSIVNRIALGAGVVAVLLAIMVIASLLAIVSLRRAESREARSQDVTVAALQIRSSTAELDSSLRGYVLTRNPQFLVFFRAARQQLAPELRRLRTLVADAPAQRARAADVSAAVTGYLRDYAGNVIVIAQISWPAARSKAANNEGKRRTEAIRQPLAAIAAAERTNTRRASRHARGLARIAIGAGATTLLLSIGLVLGFGAWVSRGVAWPVRRVAAAAGQVAGGDLHVRLPPAGTAEVGTLVGAFNAMTRSLELGRDELIAQNELLRASERQKQDLITMVSHEVRTPLSSVLGFTALLLERDFTQEEQRRYLEIIDAQARRLAALAGDFLDVKLLEGRGFTLVRTRLDLIEIVRQQADVFFAEPSTHAVELVLPGEPVIVDGDADRLAQVVGNLCSNALKYAPADTTVTITVEAQDADVVVSVRDRGRGVSPEERELIFEKFFRGESVAASVAGTGLGLAVARQIAESHGGSLDVVSPQDGGATFVLRLPLAVRRAASARA